jgi:hypothetical protein
VLSYLLDVVDASRAAVSPPAGTPAGTLVARAVDLRFHGSWTVMAGDSAPSAGELAVFCRPVVTAPAVVRRDGSVRAGGWLPDFVRLGELERHLGDGVIEEPGRPPGEQRGSIWPDRANCGYRPRRVVAGAGG